MTNPLLLRHHRREIAEAIDESKRGMQAGMGSVRLSRPLVERMLAIIDGVPADEPSEEERLDALMPDETSDDQQEAEELVASALSGQPDSLPEEWVERAIAFVARRRPENRGDKRG